MGARITLFLLAINITVNEVYAFSGSNIAYDEQRREFLSFLLTTSSVLTVNPLICDAKDHHLRDYANPALPKWKGTSLPGPLSLSDTYKQISSSNPSLNMGRWPDPILRHKSSQIPMSIFKNEKRLEQLQLVAKALKNTARNEGAVGLAAQQLGINASLIFIDNIDNIKLNTNRVVGAKNKDTALGGVFGQSKWRRRYSKISSGEGITTDDHLSTVLLNNQQSKQDKGIFLVNPRIIHRSPESEMLVWTEECLVLPPQFRATLLRDADVTIEYETLELDTSLDLMGVTKQITLQGELARCCQHEMDHDRGILIVDHVPLDELLSTDGSTFMADIEDADGLHLGRMQRAYSRYVSESSLLPRNQNMVSLAMDNRLGYHSRVTEHNSPYWFVNPANAMDNVDSPITPQSSPGSQKLTNSPDCDEKCLDDRKRIIQERRAMMQQSRSNTRRLDVLELSQQRALMYHTEYRGLSPQKCQGFCP